MIDFLVTLLLLAIVLYVVHLIIGMLALPQQVKTIAYLIIGVIALLWLLSYLGIYSGGPSKPIF